jgi:hypothetical protein
MDKVFFETDKFIEKSTFVLRMCSFWRRHPDLNRGIKVLQTFALPLGYSAETPFFYGWGSRKKQRELL